MVLKFLKLTPAPWRQCPKSVLFLLQNGLQSFARFGSKMIAATNLRIRLPLCSDFELDFVLSLIPLQTEANKIALTLKGYLFYLCIN